MTEQDTQIIIEKKKVRELLLGMLRKMSKEEIEEKSKNIIKKLKKEHRFSKAKSIMMFWPLKDEPQIKELIVEAKENGKKVFLPVIEENKITVKEYTAEETLKKNFLGVMEPSGKKENNGKIDLILVPGIGFTREGKRLGRGGGYYDRFLSEIDSETEKIGLCFDFQICNELPFSSKDVLVDSVISN